MKYEYPAVFYNDCGKIAFHFPDLEGLHSFGDNFDEAILAAEELLSDYFWEQEQNDKVYPSATPLEQVEVKRLQAVKMIYADTDKYAAELATHNEREAILNADNPIRELLDRRHMKIKQLADLLQCHYRTAQDWSLGKSKPPEWCLKLIVDKVLA
ncbi:MAG: type II toxin-antitoxin system HicB family antitoxin [Selenomonadaceae bacterium]|nr:type II toxin-antitoxin system HicB family antitoxin [Selenomonadaceae bacterium]